MCGNPEYAPAASEHNTQTGTQAGFRDRGGTATLRDFVHPNVLKPGTISGKLGGKAKQYQIRAVEKLAQEAEICREPTPRPNPSS